MRILARIAFGQDVHAVVVEPLNAHTLARARSSQQHLRATLRMVAVAWKDQGPLLGQVRLDAVPLENPLSRTRAEWNALQIIRADGKVMVVSGRGAGRWPTTEAIMADLIELRHAQFAADDRQLTQDASTRSAQSGPG